MADTVTPTKRSEVMSRIRAKDTGPELAVRSLLHGMGYRFRLHRPDLPGKPDIVLPRYRAVILVHGCFWHRHPGCRLAYMPKSRRDFWQAKFAATVCRDVEVEQRLKALGWHVLIVWQCELETQTELATRLRLALGSYASARGRG